MNWYLSEIHEERLKEWKSNLKPAIEDSDDAWGRFTYSITPTHAGNVYSVRDNLSGSEIDVTDFSNW